MIDNRFKQWIIATDTVILLCWDLGHIWNQSIYADIQAGPHGEHLLRGRCERGCGVTRIRHMSSTWTPESDKDTYDYPRGYSPRGLYRADGFFMDAENTYDYPQRGLYREDSLVMDAEHRAFIRRELARRTTKNLRKPSKRQN